MNGKKTQTVEMRGNRFSTVCVFFRKKSPPDVPGGRCRHAVLAAALAGAKRTGSYLLTYGAVRTVSIVVRGEGIDGKGIETVVEPVVYATHVACTGSRGI